MSELTPCNFCNLRWMRAKAEHDGLVVTLLPCERGDFEGTDVFVHPPDVTVEPWTGGEPHPTYWRCWMQVIGGECGC